MILSWIQQLAKGTINLEHGSYCALSRFFLLLFRTSKKTVCFEKFQKWLNILWYKMGWHIEGSELQSGDWRRFIRIGQWLISVKAHSLTIVCAICTACLCLTRTRFTFRFTITRWQIRVTFYFPSSVRRKRLELIHNCQIFRISIVVCQRATICAGKTRIKNINTEYCASK